MHAPILQLPHHNSSGSTRALYIHAYMHTNYRIRINPTNNRRNVKFNLLSTVQPATKLHKKKQMPVQLGIMILTLFLA